MDIGKTAAAFKAGDIRALSRLVSLVESKDSESLKLMASLYREGAPSSCLGITGPPGAGKSTLVDHLIKRRRAQGKTVGILAIDPSSPFSGGAVLGDRIRMQQHASDPGVFIRSLGSRGAHGGLSNATRDLVRLYQAFGFDEAIVETVGVGQTELDIMELADTTIVVLVPEAGDTIQTMKAGLTEIADIFVVNKSDRPGAAAIVAALQQMVELGEGVQQVQDHDAGHRAIETSPSPSAKLPADRRSSHPPKNWRTGEGEEEGQGWHIPVLQTTATKGTGVGEILQTVDAHRDWQQRHPANPDKMREMREAEFMHMATEQFGLWISSQVKTPVVKTILDQLFSGALNPYTAVAALYHHLDMRP